MVCGARNLGEITGLVSDTFKKEILSLLQSAVLVTDADGRIRCAAGETEPLLSLPPAEAEGKAIETLFPREDRKVLVPNILKVVAKKGSYRGDVLLAGASGSGVLVHLNARRMALGAGGVHVLWSFFDLGRVKEIEKSCQSIETLSVLGGLTRRISREIGSCLVRLTGAAYKIERSVASDNPALAHLSDLRRELESLETLIRQVEAFAAMGRPDPRKENLLDGLQSLVAELRPAAAERGATLRLRSSVGPDGALLYMDPDLILFALRNLLEMRLQALENGGRLEIALAEQESSLLVECEGVGQAVSLLAPNGSLCSFLEASKPVDGLRLALVAHVVEIHGGSLEMHRSSDRGTVVRIRLPRDRRQSLRTQAL